MSWERETFINELSNGAIKEFISRGVDEEWIVSNFGSLDKCVEIVGELCAEDYIIDECIDEILSIVLTKILDREHTKEY